MRSALGQAGAELMEALMAALRQYQREAERLGRWNDSETSGRNRFPIAKVALDVAVGRIQRDIAIQCEAWFDGSAFRVEEYRWVA